MAIEIFFGTNREIKKRNLSEQPTDFGTKINKHKPLLHFGKARVSDNGKKVEEVYTSQDTYPEQLCCSQDIFDEIQDRIYKGIDIIVFFHGFNNTFKDSLMEAAQLKRLYEQENNCEYTTIVFSWPSEGRLLFSYKSDRHDARESRKVFGSGIYKLSRFLMALCRLKLIHKTASDTGDSETPNESDENFACGRLHFMAHSMGNYVLRHVLQELYKITGDKIPKLFDEILLIAADADEDSFKHAHKLKFLPEFARRISVYFNQADIPLAISDLFMDNMNRLGSDGPSQPYNVPANVSLINCKEVVKGFSEHNYHKTEQAVIHDISYVLKGWKSEDIPGRIYSAQTNSYRLIDSRTDDQLEASDLTLS